MTDYIKGENVLLSNNLNLNDYSNLVAQHLDMLKQPLMCPIVLQINNFTAEENIYYDMGFTELFNPYPQDLVYFENGIVKFTQPDAVNGLLAIFDIVSSTAVFSDPEPIRQYIRTYYYHFGQGYDSDAKEEWTAHRHVTDMTIPGKIAAYMHFMWLDYYPVNSGGISWSFASNKRVHVSPSATLTNEGRIFLFPVFSSNR